MSKGFFNAISKKTSTYVWATLLFNCFGLKMFIDVGNYDILSPLFFFHFIGSLLFALALSAPTPSSHTFIRASLHSLTAWPSFGLILLHGNISLAHLTLYFTFLISIILSIQFILLMYAHTHQLFYAITTLFFLWGTNLVIESIPMMYDVLAPLSISYHYTLATEGILHVSTGLYFILLPFTFFGIYYAKKH